jgi:hypothetical protein
MNQGRTPMKKKEYFTLWKTGFFLTLKIYALAYAVQIVFTFSLGLLLGIIGPMLPNYVGLAIVLLLALIFAPPLIAIGAEHLKITREPKNKFGIDFTA